VLQSPRSPLCVYKKIGWCLQRNNWPLCNSWGLQPVVQNLEDAQTLALIYSRYDNREDGPPMHWHVPNDPTPRDRAMERQASCMGRGRVVLLGHPFRGRMRTPLQCLRLSWRAKRRTLRQAA
jgi:hypothetical protein